MRSLVVKKLQVENNRNTLKGKLSPDSFGVRTLCDGQLEKLRPGAKWQRGVRTSNAFSAPFLPSFFLPCSPICPDLVPFTGAADADSVYKYYITIE